MYFFFIIFENKVLRKIFGEKFDTVTGEFRRLHNKELEKIFNSPSIVAVMKSGRTRWAGHVVRMGAERAAHRIPVGKPEGKRLLGRPQQRWEGNVRKDVGEAGFDRSQSGENWHKTEKNGARVLMQF